MGFKEFWYTTAQGLATFLLLAVVAWVFGPKSFSVLLDAGRCTHTAFILTAAFGPLGLLGAVLDNELRAVAVPLVTTIELLWPVFYALHRLTFTRSRGVLVGILLAPLELALVALAVWGLLTVAVATWPVNVGFLGVVLFLWAAHVFRWDESTVVGKIMTAVASPIAVGLAIVLTVTLLFNALAPSVRIIRSLEQTVGVVAESSHWFEFSYWSNVGLIVGLAGIAMLAPTLRPLTHGLRLKEWLNHAALAVTTISSFTFFVQATYQYDQWRHHGQVLAMQHREPLADDVQRLAIRNVTRALTDHFDAPRRAPYVRTIARIEDTIPFRDQQPVIDHIARAMVDDLWTRAQRNVTAAADRSDVAGTNTDNRSTSELMEALKSLFSETLGLVGTPLRGVAAKLVEALVDAEADRVFDNKVVPLARERLPAFADFLDHQAVDVFALRRLRDALKDIKLTTYGEQRDDEVSADDPAFETARLDDALQSLRVRAEVGNDFTILNGDERTSAAEDEETSHPVEIHEVP